jgi:TRAP transporter TAXI family solute receptor
MGLRRVLLLVCAAVALGGCVALKAHGASPPRGRVVIAAGGRSGVYYAYARALARELRARAPELRVSVVSTSGSVENLRRVSSGRATLAFTAADAVAGHAGLTAIARVYDDYLHLIVRASSPARSLRSLRGAAVSVGQPGSGTRLFASRLLAGHSVRPVGLGLDDSIAALRAGRIAGFFWSGGLPTPGVAALARDVPLRLLALDASRLARYGAVYRAAAIPGGTYGLASQVSTVAVPNLIVARAGADPALVRLVVATLFERRAAIAGSVVAAAALDRRAAIETAPVPLHPAASRWFRDTKA